MNALSVARTAIQNLAAKQLRLVFGVQTYAVTQSGYVKIADLPLKACELALPRDSLANAFGDTIAFNGDAFCIHHDNLAEKIVVGPQTFQGKLFKSDDGAIFYFGEFQASDVSRSFALVGVNLFLFIFFFGLFVAADVYHSKEVDLATLGLRMLIINLCAVVIAFLGLRIFRLSLFLKFFSRRKILETLQQSLAPLTDAQVK